MTGISNEPSSDVHEQHQEAMQYFHRFTAWEQQLLDSITVSFAYGWRLSEKQAFHLKLIYEKARHSDWQRFKAGDCGTRLPEDWQPSPTDLAFASGLGVDAVQLVGEFRNYWRHTRPTPTGYTPDWSSVWRYWCRRVSHG